MYPEIIVIYCSIELILKDFIERFVKHFKCSSENIHAVNPRLYKNNFCKFPTNTANIISFTKPILLLYQTYFASSSSLYVRVIVPLLHQSFLSKLPTNVGNFYEN